MLTGTHVQDTYPHKNGPESPSAIERDRGER